MKHLFILCKLVALSVSFMSGQSASQTATLMVEGYDVVSYFQKQGPVKGETKWAVIWSGNKYLFKDERNQSDFLRTPERYVPQYGGWCAYAMGKDGSKVQVDPKTFKISNGKLYLFYHTLFNNTLKKWNLDEENQRVRADQNWKSKYFNK